MRFFLDENETPAILAPLRTVFFQHEFIYTGDLSLKGTDDKPLFAEIAELRFDAIITRDRNQLADDGERKALADHDLHWIGHKEPAATGLKLVACLAAGYLSALPFVIEEIAAASEPTAFHVKNHPTLRDQRIRAHALRHR